MDSKSNYRRWDDLMPDALALIFNFLSLKEVLTAVPSVCKSWDRAVRGPYCWQEIDIKEWSIGRPPKIVDRMLRMLITRSCGTLRKLSVSNVKEDETFAFITEHAGCLNTLSLTRSGITYHIVQETAWKLAALTSLDLSYCSQFYAPGTEAIGKNCKSLVRLCRNQNIYDLKITTTDDLEARAIANTMPKLRHLELTNNHICNDSVYKILAGCRDLQFLDLRGCCRRMNNNDELKAKCSGLNVLGLNWEPAEGDMEDEF